MLIVSWNTKPLCLQMQSVVANNHYLAGTCICQWVFVPDIVYPNQSGVVLVSLLIKPLKMTL